MKHTKVFIYATQTGKVPFIEWEKKLESKTKVIIKTRIDRLKVGNFGDSKVIKNGNGVCELRIDYGPGYRIYFGKQDNMVIVLLVGGNKGSQHRDVEKAKQYWLESKKLTKEFLYEK